MLESAGFGFERWRVEGSGEEGEVERAGEGREGRVVSLSVGLGPVRCDLYFFSFRRERMGCG